LKHPKEGYIIGFSFSTEGSLETKSSSDSDHEFLRVGVDVGGTFTDVVFLNGKGDLSVHKVPSTPPQFEQGVTGAIRELLNLTQCSGTKVKEIAHGTTVATNAVLERRGAKTALITTKGFRDVLELRRIKVPVMYDWFFEKPKTLVNRSLRFEISERILASGEVQVALQEKELWLLKRKLEKELVESIAVCFLHAYAYPKHELMVGEFLNQHFPDIPVSLSFEVLPERNEYERTATTVVNAYVRPVMRSYLEAMRAQLYDLDIRSPLLIMQSAGGLATEKEAVDRPVFVLESGPAAGVLAAKFMGSKLGLPNLITFDMGGTTAKASMVEEGCLSYQSEYEVGASLSVGSRLMGGNGEIIRAPSIDIAEVGAGGGSVAYLDQAGGLHVGPKSSGAFPGPACYQQGGQDPTVTDANVVLGFIRPGQLADGQICIDPKAAWKAIHDRIAKPLGMSVLQAAEGIYRIANTIIIRALREVSTERGRDPRDFSLIAFGGAGPIHAANLAEEILIRKIVIPPKPGLFSAMGLLFSDVEHHKVHSCVLPIETTQSEVFETIRKDLRETILNQFENEGYKSKKVELAESVDMHFQGQTSKIQIPLVDMFSNQINFQSLGATFKNEHEKHYGHRSNPENPIEIVAFRIVGKINKPKSTYSLKISENCDTGEHFRLAYFGLGVGQVKTPVVTRKSLKNGRMGPLLIDEYDSTIVVPPKMKAWSDEHYNIIITRVKSNK